MLNRLDHAQNLLFKRILGLPKSCANEAVYLLLDLIPISRQIDLEVLLVLGQYSCLTSDRIEKRTLVNALFSSTPLTGLWDKTLCKYNLPNLCNLLNTDVSYSDWKKIVISSIYKQHHAVLENAVASKSTLSLWIGRIPQDKNRYYPKQISSPLLREAVYVRAQLSCQTYPTNARLFTIHQSVSKTCDLCKSSAVENVIHFVAECPVLSRHRRMLQECIADDKELTNVAGFFSEQCPLQFTLSILLLPDISLSHQARNTLNLLILKFLHKIHLSRTALLQYH